MLREGEEKSLTLKDELKRRAEKALDKPPRYGLDLEISEFTPDYTGLEAESLRDLSERLRNIVKSIGLDTGEKSVLGSYLQVDQRVAYSRSHEEGVKVLSLKEALKSLDWLKSLYWKAVPVDLDKFTAVAALYEEGGYVVVAEKGVKTEMPVQTCLLMKSPRSLQTTHNIVVAEEGSTLHVITGCTQAPESFGLHAGISEFYVGRNATVTFTMIHSWSRGSHIRPRTGVVVEEGGRFISNYVVLKPANTIQAYPVVRLVGRGSSALTTSILLGSGSSKMDIGSCIRLEAPQTSGEAVSKVVGGDSSETVVRSRIVGFMDGVRGHTECNGILVSEKAVISAIPELVAKAKDVELTHEAAIGRISEEEVFYLRARGFTEEEAVSMIVRGFLESGIVGLPKAVEEYLKKAVRETITAL